MFKGINIKFYKKFNNNQTLFPSINNLLEFLETIQTLTFMSEVIQENGHTLVSLKDASRDSEFLKIGMIMSGGTLNLSLISAAFAICFTTENIY